MLIVLIGRTSSGHDLVNKILKNDYDAIPPVDTSQESLLAAASDREVHTVILEPSQYRYIKSAAPQHSVYGAMVDAIDEVIRNRLIFLRLSPKETEQIFQRDKEEFCGIQDEADIRLWSDVGQSNAQLAYTVYTKALEKFREHRFDRDEHDEPER